MEFVGFDQLTHLDFKLVGDEPSSAVGHLAVDDTVVSRSSSVRCGAVAICWRGSGRRTVSPS